MVDSTEQAPSAEHAQLIQAVTLAAPAAKLVFWRHNLATGTVQWLPPAQHPFAADDPDLSKADRILASVLPEDRPAVLAARERARHARDIVELEYRVRDGHGAVRHVLTRRLGIPCAQGASQEVIGVLIDVTVQRERELALRRIGAQQQLALRALRACSFRFDVLTRVFEFDDAMVGLYGLQSACSTLNFTGWLALVHPDDQAQMRHRARSILDNGEPLPTERFRICRPDGLTLQLEVDHVLEHDAHGRLVAAVGTHRDVTREATLAAQARALADATLAARARAELLATLAHELRTPLNAVTGFAQLLQLGRQGLPPDPGVAHHAHHIQVAGEMMTAVLDDLTDLAGADAGVLRWQAQAVPVQALLLECRAWLQQRDGGWAERLEIDAAVSELVAWADPVRARQIMLNLLSNALKYSELEVLVSARPLGHSVGIAVLDRGQGLDAAQVARAFEPFERLGREHGEQPGTGLGLAVCRRLARLMGGEVQVCSTPGEGSEFTLWLPAGAVATRS